MASQEPYPRVLLGKSVPTQQTSWVAYPNKSAASRASIVKTTLPLRVSFTAMVFLPVTYLVTLSLSLVELLYEPKTRASESLNFFAREHVVGFKVFVSYSAYAVCFQFAVVLD